MATQLKDKKSVRRIIDEMTLREKVELLTGSSPFRGGKNEKYGIPAPLLLDGGTGLNLNEYRLDACFMEQERTNGKYQPESIKQPLEPFGIAMRLLSLKRTKNQDRRYMEVFPDDENIGCFPDGNLLGATMNPAVIRSCGEAVGREASANKVDVLLGSPNVNILRDPRNGRFFEGYSEDPCAVSKLAPAFSEGVQNTGVLANVKHFAANNQETDRMGIDERIDERTLQEIYLPGFKACIKSGCKTLMTAYNRINGTAGAENPALINDLLRKKWGFKGFVMSDWGGAYDRTAAIKAGNDLTMPGPREIGSVIRAVSDGKIKEEDINAACRNYLYGVLEMPIMNGRKYNSIDTSYSMKIAYETACQGITLLKNNGVLPLSGKSKIAFFGSKSKKILSCGTGSAGVATKFTTNLFDTSVKELGKERVTFEKIEKDTSCVVMTAGTGSGEGVDRKNLLMDKEDEAALKKAIREAKKIDKPIILVLNIPGPVDISNYIDDLDAVLCIYYPGMGGGQAVMDVLNGKINPSGKLPFSYPRHCCDMGSYLNFPGENRHVTYGEGIYVGYRYYDAKNIEPLFPFGFGLSYTKFRLSDLQIPEDADIDNEDIRISLKIKNTGKYAGAEVVQIYISNRESSIKRPVKELKDFRKVYLPAGEEKELQFKICKDDLSSFNTQLGDFVTEPGRYEISVGTDSRHISLKKTINIRCYNQYSITENSEIKQVMMNEKAVRIIEKNLPMIDFKEVAAMYIIFIPFTSFKDVWDRSIDSALSEITKKERQRIYSHIISEFKLMT